MSVSKENIWNAVEEITRDSEVERAKYAQIITTQEERDEKQMPKRKLVYLRQLCPFPNHPFSVKEDADMQSLRESIQISGIRTPIEVIPTGERNERGEDTYYIVAGHRRAHIAEQLYPESQRIEIRIQNMTMDEAIVAMAESNLLTREIIRPCERGKALRMEVEAKERINGRPKAGHHPEPNAVRPRDEVGEAYGMTGRNVQNYIRLSYLIPELQNIVDDGKLGMTTAVELSYLSEKDQNQVWDNLYLNEFEHYPSKAQAVALRKKAKSGELNIDDVVRIMDVPKPNQMEHIRYTVRKEELVEKLPAELQADTWDEKDFSAFIEKAVTFYADTLMQEQEEKEKEQEEMEIDWNNRASYEQML